MTFPDEPTLHGRTFSDVDGASTAMTEWMAAVGAALNALAIGPIITDQSDGHTYRIVSTNGVLSTVQVT